MLWELNLPRFSDSVGSGAGLLPQYTVLACGRSGLTRKDLTVEGLGWCEPSGCRAAVPVWIGWQACFLFSENLLALLLR